MPYHVIYDGNCNLCVTLVQLLENLDKGQEFNYIPMQDQTSLKQFGITPADCEGGMILIDAKAPEKALHRCGIIQEGIGTVLCFR